MAAQLQQTGLHASNLDVQVVWLQDERMLASKAGCCCFRNEQFNEL
jgi:hypothetical protein